MKITDINMLIKEFRNGWGIWSRANVELAIIEIERLRKENHKLKVSLEASENHLVLMEVNEMLKKTQARVEELEAQQRWIPVSERLPETNMFNDHFSEMVLTTNGSDFYVSSWCGEGKIWTHPYIVNLEVTHWQPLLQPPQDQESK